MAETEKKRESGEMEKMIRPIFLFYYSSLINLSKFRYHHHHLQPPILHSPPHLLSSTSTAVLLPRFTILPNFRSLKTSTKPYQFSTRHLTPFRAQLSDSSDGPVKLPFSLPSFISTDDDPTSLQVATSVLLTGAVSIFLFLSLRRRAKRAKELVHSHITNF